ncbi:hypothetical protein CCR75_004448 [Bremia lactucae]|uniref:Uncharacterized protein n=1 Tax=Bremia lactucae TaxID=4779 RepID=A0A976IIH7_BRELC|nr:hypothetical protein CCR75_004448 [Bremia lactucae]
MDLQSTRAHFMQVSTSTNSTLNHASEVSHILSPPSALNLSTPRVPDFIAGDGILIGAWASGLFDCFGNVMPNCIMVSFCPFVALAQLSTRLGAVSYTLVLSLLLCAASMQLLMLTVAWNTAGSYYESTDKLDSGFNKTHGEGSNGFFVIVAIVLQMMLFNYIWHLRVKTRRRFQLPGSAVTDCLSSWCCSCCTVDQLRTHVRCYEPGKFTFKAPDVLQAYPGKTCAV